MFFFSLTFKVFASFWLITIISIFSTRFISQQISSDMYSNVVSSEPQQHELRRLQSTTKKIIRSKVKSVEQMLASRRERFIKPPYNLWLKSVGNNPVVTSFFRLPIKEQRAIRRYIDEETFDKAISSRFSHTQLIGPTLVTINKKDYQLFISRGLQDRHFGKLVQALPGWARITIPVLISFILCLLLVRIGRKPIVIIKKAVTELGKGNLATRIEQVTQRKDEIGQLAISFNNMAEQLQKNQTAQQRLLGDVSHELRSPMTRLQMALGLAQQDSTTPSAREQYLQRCQLEVERLNLMIEDALALSRLENTLKIIQKKNLSFTALIEKIIHEEQFVANDTEIKITLNSDKSIELSGDYNLLFSAISNVITNAVKYSPPKSIVDVRLSIDEEFATLVICDNGIGVPTESLSELFTPFYRVNLARDRKTGGTGLGLAIAKQAIIAHQGNIFAKNNKVKGLSVTIQLPL